MASKKSQGVATKKTQGFDEGSMAFLEACIKSEMNVQIHFGEEWGPLVGGPRSVDEAIEMKRKELEDLRKLASTKAVSDKLEPPAFTSTARSHFNDSCKPNLEAGLNRSKLS